MRMLARAVFLLLLAHSGPSHALTVVVTLPWLGDVTARLAPDAHLVVLARGTEDPHYLSPTPALMAKVGKADLYVENGMNLELWSARMLDGAGNPSIRPGQPGYVLASTGVPRLEVPTELTRAKGDLHPEGNPHVWLDPLNVAVAADNIAAGLARVDPSRAESYQEAARALRQTLYERLFGADLVDFMGGGTLEKLARSGRLHEFLASKGLTSRLGGWLGEAPPGRKVVFYHQSWAYLVDRFAIEQVGVIEDRPGIAPSAGHKDRLAAAMESSGCDRVAVTSYYSDRVARVLAEQTGVPLVRLAGDVGGVPEATDYFTLMDHIVQALYQ
ncbi:MAG: metal ABC transporter substrate-binding protein [Myxococcota bacterium]|nr:metal ABC transporter substrate-binding protein [Myxococcota bacterium]